MIKTTINFGISLLITLIPTIIITLLITALSTYMEIPYVYAKMMIHISSIILLFLFAFIFGKKQKNHGIFHGLLLVAIFLFISLVVIKGENNYLITGSKCLALLFGSITGVNFSSN